MLWRRIFSDRDRHLRTVINFIQGDVLATLPQLEAKRFRTCCSSPPYFGLRDYGHPEQIGLEETDADYIAKLVRVFREVKRVLKDDGTLWVNLGDNYAGSWGAQGREGSPGKHSYNRSVISARQIQAAQRRETNTGSLSRTPGLKNKDIIGIPWRVAFALQADGWFLRSAIPWIKRNPMPESVSDRPSSAVEYVFMFSKTENYFYDADAIAMPQSEYERSRRLREQSEGLKTVYDLKRDQSEHGQVSPGKNGAVRSVEARQVLAQKGTRNRRNTDWFFASWQGLYQEDGIPLAFVVNPKGLKEAHFAVWPEKLVEPMILAGSELGDEVLDVFGGSGTTGKVAIENGRRATLLELNPDYIDIARRRCETTVGLPLS